MIAARFAMHDIVLSGSLYLSHPMQDRYHNQPTNPPPLQALQYLLSSTVHTLLTIPNKAELVGEFSNSYLISANLNAIPTEHHEQTQPTEPDIIHTIATANTIAISIPGINTKSCPPFIFFLLPVSYTSNTCHL